MFSLIPVCSPQQVHLHAIERLSRSARRSPTVRIRMLYRRTQRGMQQPHRDRCFSQICALRSVTALAQPSPTRAHVPSRANHPVGQHAGRRRTTQQICRTPPKPGGPPPRPANPTRPCCAGRTVFGRLARVLAPRGVSCWLALLEGLATPTPSHRPQAPSGGAEAAVFAIRSSA